MSAAKQVLNADRGSVWLYDPAADELVLEVATGIKPVRVPAGAGLVGACARDRQIINVPTAMPIRASTRAWTRAPVTARAAC